MKDRYDLENEIYQIDNIADQIYNLLEHQHQLTEDQRVNTLIGIAQILHNQTLVLMDTMCQVLKLDQYNQQKQAAEPKHQNYTKWSKEYVKEWLDKNIKNK